MCGGGRYLHCDAAHCQRTYSVGGGPGIYLLYARGETVACVVTQAGIALNPRHRNYAELREDLERAGIKPVDIQELRRLAEELTGRPEPIKTTQRIVAVVEYRDGTVVDVVREVAF